jgi:hypothetical protein
VLGLINRFYRHERGATATEYAMLIQDRSEQVLRRLSADIFARPRPIVLAELWGVEFGRLSFLKRLPGRVLPRHQYDHLVAALLDPQLRDLLHQCSKISPGEIELIGHFERPVLAAVSLRTASKIGAELFDYVITAVHRHRPDLDDIGLVTVLRELGRADGLSVSYALSEAMDDGHCGLPTDELIPLAQKLLEARHGRE